MQSFFNRQKIANYTKKLKKNSSETFAHLLSALQMRCCVLSFEYIPKYYFVIPSYACIIVVYSVV